MIYLLFILFQIKHFLADYVFQNKYMLGKFDNRFTVWFPALCVHAFVHILFTVIILLPFVRFSCKWLLIFELVSHIVIDIIKASRKLLGRWKPDNKYFWWALGLDQMLHNFVYVYMIYIFMREGL